MNMVIVVDYGIGNVGSIMNMLKKVGVKAMASAAPKDILKAERLILPGVGSFDAAIKRLRSTGCSDALNQKVQLEHTPILGICLGMQLFTRGSEEGCESGLGWLDANTVRFSFSAGAEIMKIPHMGWNDVHICKTTPIFKEGEEQRFYFVHSYHIQCTRRDDVLTTTHYGVEFVSAVCRGNILGTQFHPEKSHRFGLQLFKAFLSWAPKPGL